MQVSQDCKWQDKTDQIGTDVQDLGGQDVIYPRILGRWTSCALITWIPDSCLTSTEARTNAGLPADNN